MSSFLLRFENVFRFNPDVQYGPDLLRQIVENRGNMGGILFFDRFLERLNIRDRRIYPPRTNKDIRKLHASIVQAQIPHHYKLAILYYILCDCTANSAIDFSEMDAVDTFYRRTAREESVFTTRTRNSASPAPSASTIATQPHEFSLDDLSASRAAASTDHSPAERFAANTCLPKSWLICMRGLWDLDRYYVSTGVEQLVDPSVQIPFFDDVLTFLVDYVIKNCGSADSLAESPSNCPKYILAQLPLQLLHSSSSRPSSLQTHSSYVRYLTIFVGVDAAHAHMKQFPPQTKAESRLLFEQIILDVLTHPFLQQSTLSASRAQPDGQTMMYPVRSARAAQLANMNMSSEEESWFENCLLTGTGSFAENGRDLLIMRRMALGKSLTDLVSTASGLESMSTSASRWNDYCSMVALPAHAIKAGTFFADLQTK